MVGANILANDIKLDVAGKTTIESAVDTYEATNSSSGGSMGFGAGKDGLSSVNLGYNEGKGNSSIASVGSQTSIIGTNSVSGKTNSLHINGGILGNINQQGVDKGNMHLTAEKLTYANIQEHNTSSSSSMGLNISTSVGKNAGGTLANSKGSMQATNQGSDNKGVTLATLGQGSITNSAGKDMIKTAENVGPEVKVSGTSNTAGETETTLSDNGINRDIDNTQVEGNTITTGALDIDITVDVASIVNAIDNGKDIAKFVGKGANYVISGIENITKENAVKIVEQTAKIDDIIAKTGSAPSIEQQLEMQGITDPEKQKELIILLEGKLTIRNDGVGGGNHEDNRGDGRKHQGVDFVATPGEGIYSPVDGTMTSLAPYSKGTSEKLAVPGIAIETNEGELIIVYYVNSDLLNSKNKGPVKVTKGQEIGKAFDIANCYNVGTCSSNKDDAKANNPMTNHIHVEVRLSDYKIKDTKEERLKNTINPINHFNLQDRITNNKSILKKPVNPIPRTPVKE